VPVERRGVAEVIECAQPQDVECGQSFVDPADGVVAAESVEDLSEDHVGECYASVGVDKSEQLGDVWLVAATGEEVDPNGGVDDDHSRRPLRVSSRSPVQSTVPRSSRTC
jgi:hypothetical protein